VSDEEKSDHEFLRDLAKRLTHVPTMYGTGDYDIDRLLEIAKKLEPYEPHDVSCDTRVGSPYCSCGRDTNVD
jgi:hypothetical protein